MTTDIDIRTAHEPCTNAKFALDHVRGHIESGVNNPYRPNPLGEVAYSIAQVRQYLTQIEQALKLPADPPPG
jgi:hypothetical protein